MVKINENDLQIRIEKIVKDIDSFFGKGNLTGFTYDRIVNYGEYNEGGIVLDKKDIPLFQNYAGLAILTKDMREYLKKNPRQDSELFEEFLNSSIKEDKEYYDKYNSAFPYDDLNFRWKNELSNMPSGLAKYATEGQPSVRELGDQKIVHEWTVKPGWRILKHFKLKSKFKEKLRANMRQKWTI
jgi:hypothetical protein